MIQELEICKPQGIGETSTLFCGRIFAFANEERKRISGQQK